MTPSDELRAESQSSHAGDVGIDARSSEEAGSQFEAVAAVVHHKHHPADPNVGVVRGRLGRGAVVAALLSAAVTLTGVVFLALAIENGTVH